MPPASKEKSKDTTDTLLREIRDLLKAQQQTLDQLKTAPTEVAPHRTHWRYLLIMTLIVLSVGSYGAYQYYKVLQSIIDQFPHGM